MSRVNCIETYIEKDKTHYACFVIEPLEIGQGITLGNALRRTLLSDLSGFSIVGIRINNLRHEFASIRGLREDILEIVLNLKEIIFKPSFSAFHQKQFPTEIKGFLNVKGPLILTAGMFQLPKDMIQILNVDHYIGTLVDTTEFYMEIDIQNGKGYRLTEETRRKNMEEKLSKNVSTILIDALKK